MRRIALGKLLSARLGDYHAALDLTRRRITFVGEHGHITAQADLIAAATVNSMAFRWGWSPELTRALDGAAPPDDMLRFGREHAMPSLTTSEFGIDVRPGEKEVEALEQTLSRAGMAAVEIFGPDAVYVFHEISPRTYLLLLVRDPSEGLPEITLWDFAELLRMWNVAVDGQEPSLEGLADCVPGWSIAVSARTRNKVVFDITDGIGGIVETQRLRDLGIWDEDVTFRMGRIFTPRGLGSGGPPRRRGLLTTMFGEHGPRKTWGKPPPVPVVDDSMRPEGSKFLTSEETSVRLAILEVPRQEPAATESSDAPEPATAALSPSDAADDVAGPAVPADGLTRWRQVLDALSEPSQAVAAGVEPERIDELERGRGLRLAADHRRYLTSQNGWVPSARTAGATGKMRIASLEEIEIDAMRMRFGLSLEEIAASDVTEKLRELGIDAGNQLTVAVDPFLGASCVMPVREGLVGPEVVTVLGWIEEEVFLGEVHPTFSAFLDSAATSAEENAASATERERRKMHVARAWRAGAAISVNGVPDDDAALAQKIVRLLRNLHEIRPVGPWRITGRPWDGRTRDLERVIAEARRVQPDGTEELYLALQTDVEGDGRWQVAVSRSRPAATEDHLLVLLTAGSPETEPRPDQMDILCLQVVADFPTTCITASSVMANRFAHERGITGPHGFRIWLPANRLGPKARAVELGEFDLWHLGSGALLSGPDDLTPEQIVTESRALVTRLGAGAEVPPLPREEVHVHHPAPAKAHTEFPAKAPGAWPSDLSVILRALDTPGWVFLRPEPGIHARDEVHDVAAQRIRDRGLAPSTAYAGWHQQQHGFTAKGELEDFQAVYWGGDAAEVRARLERLAPFGYLVLGGRDPDEPFALVKDVPSVTSTDPANVERIRARLQLVGEGTIRSFGGPSPTPGDLELCHDVIVAADADRLPDDLLKLATETLFYADELSGEEIAIAHNAGLASAKMLASWDDPRGAESLRSAFVEQDKGTLWDYVDLRSLQGDDPESVLMELAEDVWQRLNFVDPRDDRIHSIVHRLIIERGRADPSAWIVDLMRDAALPLWFREASAHYGRSVYLGVRDELEGEGRQEPVRAELREKWVRHVAEWPAFADQIFRERGIDTKGGLTVREHLAERWLRRELTHLEEHEAELLRADLTDPDRGEPELAIILEQLLTTRTLRSEDLAPLRVAWRKRLLRKPGRSSRARPAVVSMADVLLRAGDPLGEQIADAIMRDARKWTSFHKLAIEGVRAELGDDVALERLAADAPASQEGAIVHVSALAVRQGVDATQIAAELWTRTVPNPRYRQLHYGWAAIALRLTPRQPDWNISGFRIRGRQHRDAALALAADERVPEDMRDWMWTQAEGWAPERRIRR